MAPSAISTLAEDYEQLSLSGHYGNNLRKHQSHGLNNTKDLIGQAFKERVDSVDGDTCEVGDEDAFFVADVGAVYRQHLRWKLNLPRVKPHYGQFHRPILRVLLDRSVTKSYLLTLLQR
jgi:ornithine decarboxylase